VSLSYYALRVEERRVVAAEVDASVAAESLDAAQPLLLGTAEDLSRLAQRLGRPLVSIARSEPRQGSVVPRTVKESPPPGRAAGISEPVAAILPPLRRNLFGVLWNAARSRNRPMGRVA